MCQLCAQLLELGQSCVLLDPQLEGGVFAVHVAACDAPLVKPSQRPQPRAWTDPTAAYADSGYVTLSEPYKPGCKSARITCSLGMLRLKKPCRSSKSGHPITSVLNLIQLLRAILSHADKRTK
jgi:hypothetical protein